MGTFDGEKKIETRENGIAKDKVMPDLSALNVKNMPSASALAGTNATDSKLIHGDRWQQIDGNQTENIDKNLTTHIQLNEVWTVHENYVMTVEGKTLDMRHEDVKEYYFSDSRFEYGLEHTDIHRDKDHQINPTHTFDILNVEGEYKTVDFAIKATSLEGKGVSLETIIAKGEAWVAGAEAWGFQVGKGGFENTDVFVSVQDKALDLRLEGMENEIKGIHSHMGGPKVLIMPIRIGICVAIHVDSPFA